ncbi:copper chaperone PCu(A)C [Arcobacter arenosus]|uniref:Copper chaperone PCu(A)C n=2 Tax=Arcobacter arenosus TaxID=2576037 RepID=A0A5R8Y5D4_9BACT|nr:copper chaperone PCu(A)C [Arcobacter arenosus]
MFMKKITSVLLLSVMSIFASNLVVEDAYVRATPPNLPNSAAFMILKNSSNENISVLKATSDVSKAVELHTHDMQDGVMKMYQIQKIDIPAKGETVLKPGSLHIMFIGLHKPLKVGEKITFTLELSNGETKTITAPIKSVMSGMKHHGHNMKHNN